MLLYIQVLMLLDLSKLIEIDKENLMIMISEIINFLQHLILLVNNTKKKNRHGKNLNSYQKLLISVNILIQMI